MLVDGPRVEEVYGPPVAPVAPIAPIAPAAAPRKGRPKNHPPDPSPGQTLFHMWGKRDRDGAGS